MKTHLISGIRLAAPLALASLSLLCVHPAARAQGVYGTIIGTVTDSSGAVIPNATVVVTDVSKGTTQTVQSNGSGEYSVGRLIPDIYTVKATSGSFQPGEADNIAVSADSSPQVNLTLNTSGTSTNVTVTSAAPVLKTDQADVANVLNAQQVQSIPNLDRNFSSFTLYTPGVQRSSFSISPTENPQGTTATSINGSNYGTLGWVLDGTDNREPVDGIIVINPTLDSISELRVTSQNYPAEFGGAIGGFITASTKSGGNQFHGDAFEYRRSDAQEARDPFTQYQPDPVTGKFIPSSVYNQFGGSVGGPILKDKAFFFLDYQGTRQRVGTSLQESVPTNLVRSTCLTAGSVTCNLSEYVPTVNGVAGVVRNPITGQQYAANAVPVSAIAPQAIALLSALPAAQSSAASNNYVSSGNGINNGDQADVRLDDQVSGKIHAFGRYDYANFRLTGTPVFGASGGSGFGIGNTTGTDQVQNQSASIGFDDALSATLLTDFRFGFLAYHVVENKFDNGATPASAVGIPNLNTANSDTSGSPTYNFQNNQIGDSQLNQGIGNQGCNCPLQESEQVLQLANNWTKTFGNHSIRFGGDIRYAFNLRNASDNNRSGLLTFDQQSSAVAGIGNSGSDLASFLFGAVGEFQRYDSYSNSASNRQKRGGFYLQDDWRVTPKLTVNYGVRWDIVFPETVNSPGQGGFTDLTTGTIRVAGYNGYGTNGGADVDLKDLGGRFGFAYQVRPTTVFRGAFGQMYDNVGFFGTIFGSALTHNIPVVANESVNEESTLGGVAYTLNTLPAKPAPYVIPTNGNIPIPANVNPTIRPNTLTLPEVYQYNLSVQQQVTSNMTATFAYVGNLADRVYPSETEGYDVNRPVLPTLPSQLSNSDARRPYYNRFSNIYNGAVVQCCSQDITSTAPAARANYNALQTTLEQRFASGFQFLASYTWSKAMNYGAQYFVHDPRVEYGENDINRTNNFVMSGLYQLPFGKGKKFAGNSNRWVNYAIGGWELNGTTTWESGLPFTPTYSECGSDQDIDTNSGSPGTSSDCRPDKNGGASAFALNAGSFDAATHSRHYFTPVAALSVNGQVAGPFVRPQFGTIGNIGRNSFRGPADYFADASLFKNFSITERVRGEFQFQAFNVFNHVPLGTPGGNNARCIDCTTGNTGLITNVDNAVLGTGTPYMRQLQFGAKLQF